MPPFLALIICMVGVTWLLVIERQHSAGVSAAVWIPTLWMMAIASKPLGVWFGTSGDLESGSSLDRLFLSTLCVAGAIVLAGRPCDRTAALQNNAWGLFLLAYMLVSTLWSDITFIAIRRWARSCIILFMGLVLLTERNPEKALESVLRRSCYVLIPFSLLLIKYYPSLGVEYGRWSGMQMWTGVTVHKNSLGRLCMVSGIFLIWALYIQLRQNRGARITVRPLADTLVLIVTLILLRGSEHAFSATSLGALALGLVALVWFSVMKKRQSFPPASLVTIPFLLLILLGIATPFLGGSSVASLSGMFKRDETLTGRTEVWESLMPEVWARPLLGIGFGSFWTTERRELYEIPHGHNGYLDVILELGVAGIVLYAGMLLRYWKRLYDAVARGCDLAVAGICFMLMAVLHNYTESSFSSLDDQMTAVALLTSAVVIDVVRRR